MLKGDAVGGPHPPTAQTAPKPCTPLEPGDSLPAAAVAGGRKLGVYPGYPVGSPVFGMGQDSAGSITFQELLGETFFPSDVRLLVIAFQFGAAGFLLYLFFCGWLFVNLLRTLWSYAGEAPAAERAFLLALFIISLAIMPGSPIQARFVKLEGPAIAAFSLGLLIGRQNGSLDRSGAGSRGDLISSLPEPTYSN